MRKMLLFILVVFSVTTWAQNKNNELFNEATKYYNKGEYNKAIENYQSILQSGEHSAALYYNLANAHYKLNNIAWSIYYYEKALQLNPTDSDIKNNLSFAKNMTVDVINPMPESVFSKLRKQTIGLFNYEQWAIVSIVFIMLFVAVFLTYYFSANSKVKRLTFATSFILLFFGVISVLFAFLQQTKQQQTRYAIIFAKETIVKTEPNYNSSDAFKLHEGTKVLVEEQLEGWKKIELADGKEGWILEEDLKEL